MPLSIFVSPLLAVMAVETVRIVLFNSSMTLPAFKVSAPLSVFVPLNDYTATVIGMIRDNVPFNTVLSADLIYVGNTSGAPAYSPANNNHYQYLDSNSVDLSKALQQQTQLSVLVRRSFEYRANDAIFPGRDAAP